MPKRSAARMQRHVPSNTYRFFVPPEAIQGERVQIEDAALAHQIANVLRLGGGAQLTLLDNQGWEYRVVLHAVTRQRVTGVVEAQQAAGGEPRTELTLLVALLKGERFEWVLQKGTELGVSSFIPLITERSAAADIGTTKMERWQRIVREAAEQSRRGRLPQLHPAQQFEAACANMTRHTHALLLWEGEGGTALRAALQDAHQPVASPKSFALLSGPEGGWSEDERHIAIMYNIGLATLGPRILRAETAPLVAATAIFYACGDLE